MLSAYKHFSNRKKNKARAVINSPQAQLNSSLSGVLLVRTAFCDVMDLRQASRELVQESVEFGAPLPIVPDRHLRHLPNPWARARIYEQSVLPLLLHPENLTRKRLLIRWPTRELRFPRELFGNVSEPGHQALLRVHPPFVHRRDANITRASISSLTNAARLRAEPKTGISQTSEKVRARSWRRNAVTHTPHHRTIEILRHSRKVKYKTERTRSETPCYSRRAIWA